MLKNNTFFHKFALFCIALLLVLITLHGLTPAPASSQDLSRINSLQVDVNLIESRLNRIEAQLNQVGRGASPGAPIPPLASPSNSGRNRPQQLNREQMFDRLATLVIELREQIRGLETRVSKLESR